MAQVRYQIERAWDNERVKRTIKALKLPHRQLALTIGVTPQTLSRVLAGKQSSLPIVKALCCLTHLPLGEVIEGYVE